MNDIVVQAEMDIYLPDGNEEFIKMHDDGLHDDGVRIICYRSITEYQQYYHHSFTNRYHSSSLYLFIFISFSFWII